MNSITKTFSIKRLLTMGLGVATLAISLLAGALTSAAAADDEAVPMRVLAGTQMVEEGTPVIERVATNDMRVVEQTQVRHVRASKFAAPTRQLSAGCTVEFEDGDALLIQPDHVRNQFVIDPWRERCGNIWTEVIGTKYDHLHLGFVANDIGLCTDWGSEYAGTYARLGTDAEGDQVCSDFDPLTEPRTSPVSHSGTEVVRFKMYDIDGYQPFRLDQIRVIDEPIRLCAQPMDAEFGVVFEGAGDGEMSGASCWNLTQGLWNLSNYTDNTGVVTMTGAWGSGAPFSFDDIGITDQS